MLFGIENFRGYNTGRMNDTDVKQVTFFMYKGFVINNCNHSCSHQIKLI